MEKEAGHVVEKIEMVPVEREGGFVNLKIQFDIDSYAIRAESISMLYERGKALTSAVY